MHFTFGAATVRFSGSFEQDAEGAEIFFPLFPCFLSVLRVLGVLPFKFFRLAALRLCGFALKSHPYPCNP